VIEYRPFRNTDPPDLVKLWNECLPGRGAVGLRTATPLERYVLSKPYFDPAGLIIAEEDHHIVGFIHVGMIDAPEPTGVVAMICVLPRHQRRGIGTELLRRGEEYLRGKGAKLLFAAATLSTSASTAARCAPVSCSATPPPSRSS
jgi:ribosomal protein S18 acetylase RimI-like enzyme